MLIHVLISYESYLKKNKNILDHIKWRTDYCTNLKLNYGILYEWLEFIIMTHNTNI